MVQLLVQRQRFDVVEKVVTSEGNTGNCPLDRGTCSCDLSADPDCRKLSDRLLGVKDLIGVSTTGGGVVDEMISGDGDSTTGMSTYDDCAVP